MKAVVLADRAGDALRPLSSRACVALLPVGGKPLVEHTLEALVSAGIREALLLVSPQADEVERALGNGERWGMQLAYALARADDAPAAALARLGPRLPEEFLALRGDVLRSPFLASFLERARARPEPALAATVGGLDAGVVLVRAGAPRPLDLPVDPEAGDRPIGPAVEMEGAYLGRLESLAAYHRACLDAGAGRVPGLLLPAREVGVGVRIGRRSRMPLRAARGWPAFVGSRCQVHPEAELLGEVVLEDDVVVDRRATLRSTVVLPHTYVGDLVELSDAIVWGNDLVRVDTGAVTHVADAFLLADLRRQTLGSSAADGVHRGLGALALLLSLPLWPLALALSLWRSPGAPLGRRTLLSNRRAPDAAGNWAPREFTAWEWATRVPVLRHLPLLLAVIAGHLRLAGVSPLSPQEAAARHEEWEHVRDVAPAGLLGPTQLTLAGAPREERLMMDAFHARQQGARHDAAWLGRGLRALFTARAWRPQD